MDTPSVAPSIASAPASSSSGLAPEVGIPFVSRCASRAPTAERLGARVAQLSAELVAADESARRHLAGELHDGLGADLTAARFALANVETWLPDDAPDAARRALALAQQALDAATAANRRLIDGLRTPALEAGLVGTLAAWIGAHGARTGLRTSFVCAADARSRSCPPTARSPFSGSRRKRSQTLPNMRTHRPPTCASTSTTRT